MPHSIDRTRRAVTIFVMCVAASAARAQGTGTVPLGDPAYADIDRLVDLGMLDSLIVGQRPYSRREFARLVGVARSRIATDSDVSSGDVVTAPFRRLDERFGHEAPSPGWGLGGLADRAVVATTSTDARRRGFTGSITRALEATIDPLAERRLGAPAPRGQTLALELAQRLEPTSWVAFHAEERLEARAPQDASEPRRRVELLLGGARILYHNLALQVGREQIAWAQRTGDGLFLASDAPALDLVSLSGDAPFLLPGPLRRFGLAQATLVLADLGPSAVRSHSKLLAYKVSVTPRPALELGATFLNHFGGEGGRSSSLGNRLIDFLPFADIFRSHNYTDTSRTLDVDSDKLLGVDGRVRFASLGGLTVATELLIDDFDVHRIPTLFTWDGAQSLRVVLPRLGHSAFGGELSAKHTGVRTYTHGALSNGITTRGRLLGDELGPDAKGFAAMIRWQPARPTQVTLEGRSAMYSRADYVTVEQGTFFLIRRVGDASNELRDGAVVTVSTAMDVHRWLTVRAAGERVRNADFTGGTRRDYAASVALHFAR